jgi:hypothetical protein
MCYYEFAIYLSNIWSYHDLAFGVETIVILSIRAGYFFQLSSTISRRVYIHSVQSTIRVAEGGKDLHQRRREGSLAMCPIMTWVIFFGWAILVVL